MGFRVCHIHLVNEQHFVDPLLLEYSRTLFRGVLSPYLMEHIKRFGDYVIDLEERPEPLDVGWG